MFPSRANIRERRGRGGNGYESTSPELHKTWFLVLLYHRHYVLRGGIGNRELTIVFEDVHDRNNVATGKTYWTSGLTLIKCMCYMECTLAFRLTPCLDSKCGEQKAVWIMILTRHLERSVVLLRSRSYEIVFFSIKVLIMNEIMNEIHYYYY